MKLLITGGAGFVGANVALGLTARHPDWDIVALDNLRRRGSDMNLPRLRDAGVEFRHGDIRLLEDLLDVGEIDALLECSGEPSALAGFGGGTDYVVKANLLGAYNCLELARRRSAYLLFLSTSRVYPVAALQSLALDEEETRFALAAEQAVSGVSRSGIRESFPLDGARTLYGSTKLAAELLIGEYRNAFGLRAVIDRCGVIAGPWQMGKVDQGVFTFWMLAHHFARPLSYIGFGGEGKQVRDLLHVQDLLELLAEQLLNPAHWDGVTANVGGGSHCSLSLRETTALCAEITGRRLEVKSLEQTRRGDVPWYISDCGALFALTDWRPRRGPREILSEIHTWICDHERALGRAL
jgi:CDP-paratose 2-epimerase